MDYEILLRLLVAMLWGGIVGAEREYRSKSAGFRTMIMISMGACFFTIMSNLIGAESGSDRIASNIVTGIGFLGAGVIFVGDKRINGITTAATIWVVAAVGMGIGAGFYTYSAAACVLVIFILSVLPYFEKVIDKINKSVTYSINCNYSNSIISDIENLFNQNKLKYKLSNHIKKGNELTTTWVVHGSAKSHENFVHTISNNEVVKSFEF